MACFSGLLACLDGIQVCRVSQEHRAFQERVRLENLARQERAHQEHLAHLQKVEEILAQLQVTQEQTHRELTRIRVDQEKQHREHLDATWSVHYKLFEVEFRLSQVIPDGTSPFRNVDAWARGDIWSLPEQVFQDLAVHVRNREPSVAHLINQVDLRRGQFRALQEAWSDTHSLASDASVHSLGYLSLRHPGVVARLAPYLSQEELASLELPDNIRDLVRNAQPLDLSGRPSWLISTGSDVWPGSA